MKRFDEESIEQPRFKAPHEVRRFRSGNSLCDCICRAKYLPRNALLIRPFKEGKEEEIYDMLVEAWRGGKFRFLAHGSCQQFIKTFEVKKELRGILKHASVSCVDVDEKQIFKKGDILLTRHGTRGVGKPHLILEE